LRFAGEGFREAQVMMDAIVGIIGVILIIYLFATIIRPEKF
jgi:K+-transporting ATPase KdpF subunit